MDFELANTFTLGDHCSKAAPDDELSVIQYSIFDIEYHSEYSKYYSKENITGSESAPKHTFESVTQSHSDTLNTPSRRC